MKLRAEHCGVQFTVERLTEVMVDAERFVRCFVCGGEIPHTWNSDLDNWESLAEQLPGEPPIKLLKMLFTEYCSSNQVESFTDYYMREVLEVERCQAQDPVTLNRDLCSREPLEGTRFCAEHTKGGQ